MAEEVKGAITSDKVETDNTNFATIKADQTCEEVLIPRENAFRQLNWQVTMEKGSVYNPQEEIGIYAEEVDCKYGVQINGDVFGRNAVSIEHGGAVHSRGEGDTIGARVFGSILSEGQVDVVAPGSKMDDWEERPVTIYGDVMGNHITFEKPTIVYGCVTAEQTFRANASTVVLGDVCSNGLVEASDLFAFSISGRDDVTLGENIAVVNPVVRSEKGVVGITDSIGIFIPEIIDHIRENNDIETIGPWVLDVEAVWENTLQPVDVMDHGDGQIASRSWRTVEEPDERFYERVRKLFEEMIEATRKNPPDIEEFRYAGIGSLADIGGDEVTVKGDMVIGSQEKTIEETDITKIDQSTTEIDRSTEIHDESTTIEDSVVNRSDIGGSEGDDGDTPEGPTSLTDIGGIGKRKAEALRVAGYETVEALRAADREELAAIEEIGESLAEQIKAEIDGVGKQTAESGEK